MSPEDKRANGNGDDHLERRLLMMLRRDCRFLREMFNFKQQLGQPMIEFFLLGLDLRHHFQRIFKLSSVDQLECFQRMMIIFLVQRGKFHKGFRDHLEFLAPFLGYCCVPGMFCKGNYLDKLAINLGCQFFEFSRGFLEFLAGFRMNYHLFGVSNGPFEIDRLFQLMNGHLGQSGGYGRSRSAIDSISTPILCICQIATPATRPSNARQTNTRPNIFAPMPIDIAPDDFPESALDPFSVFCSIRCSPVFRHFGFATRRLFANWGGRVLIPMFRLLPQKPLP